MTHREVECTKEVMEWYEGLDLAEVLAEMERVAWVQWNAWLGYQGSWAYTTAHNICAAMGKGEKR